MSHPTLNANARQAAQALADIGMLNEFHTSIDTTLLAHLPVRSIARSAARRALPDSVHRLTRSHPSTELLRLARRGLRLGSPRLYGPDATAHAVDVAASKRLERSTAAGVYSYEDAARSTFDAAVRIKLPRIYELPLGYWRAGEQILREEAELVPSWSSTLLGNTLPNQAERRARKEDELAMATHVVVASQFAARTLQSADRILPVSTVNYGTPTVYLGSHPARGKRLRVLYIGSLTQRKGMSYLLDAVAALGDAVELTVIGRPLVEDARVSAHLEGHNWKASAPHAEILETMRSSDVFVFPSLFEGFGLVLGEALSQGLPIISTPHTAAPDLITDGKEGWIVPIRDSTAIAERLEIAVKNPDVLDEMRAAAKIRASELTWEAYRTNLANTVEEVLKT